MPNTYLDEQRDLLILELMRNGIKDERVLNAFKKVKRENFVTREFRKHSYDNVALPITNGQTISQPYTVAFMTQLLEIKDGDKILEIGTGSGFQAAILCEMNAKVYSIERFEQLYLNAKKVLSENRYDVKLKCADGTLGWKEHSPFDGIIVTAGSPDIPKSYINQISLNGKIIIPVGNKDSQEIWCAKRVKDPDGAEFLDIFKYKNFKFVPLIGKEGW